MSKAHFRKLAAGLTTLSLSGCLIIPPDTAPPAASSPTAAPPQQTSTVRRVAPPPAPAIQPFNPNTPVQYIAIPADQLVYDATGRPMAKADAIPPGFAPVMMPANAQFLPNNPVSAMAPPTTVMPPIATPAVAAQLPTASNDDEPIVIGISHTNEPPLASEPSKSTAVAPKPLPDTVNKPQLASDAVAKSEPSPLIVNNRPAAKQVQMNSAARTAMPQEAAPGAQLLVFNQPTGYNMVQAAPKSSESIPNLLIPPVAPEELKLVSTAKTPCCSSPLTCALKAYQDRQPDDADRQLAQVDPASRELLRKMLPVAAKLGEPGAPTADPGEIAELVDQLQSMAGALRAKAALRIEKLSYCRTPARPVRPGAYQPLADDHVYRPGETVELYMELRNFSCEAREKEYLTHLTTAIEVRDERNEVVAHFDFERDRPNVGQAPRQDYFHICRFPVQSLPAGQYTLCAVVTDVPTGKSATKTLPLRVETARRVGR